MGRKELRDNLSATSDRVDRDDTFIYLTRNGNRIAALMPADIAENYERIEDDYWARRAAEARDEASRPSVRSSRRLKATPKAPAVEPALHRRSHRRHGGRYGNRPSRYVGVY